METLRYMKNIYITSDVVCGFFVCFCVCFLICLWLYGIKHMVKDHSDSERGNPLPPLHRLLFSIKKTITIISFTQVGSEM